MANQIPLKVMCDGSGNTCGLAQFTSSDSVAMTSGGTGLTTQGICEFTQPGLYVVGCQVTYLGICAGKADTGLGHDNTYVGHSAGTAATTACQHTIIGSQAGKAITTCSGTVAIGYNAGVAQTFGDFNTYVGTAAGAAVITASNNTVIGYHAATATICSNNIVIGTCAMVANTQGQDNVAIGLKAGATQVAAGCNNVFVGSCVGAVALCRDNTLVGAKAGIAQTTGVKNVFLGACVGYGVQGGSNNVYVGDQAGLVNTSGNANVFIGNCAGAASTASCCLIIGNGTCEIITGNFNTASLGINAPIYSTLTVGVNDTGYDVKFFGASSGAYMEWDESVDQLRIMGAAADATTSTGKLLLATSLVDINANDVLGKIDFQAPLEAGGTDAITVAASIQAIAQATFSASVNATDLIFYTGHSEAATEKFRMTSQGEFGVGGANYGTDGQVLTSAGAGAAAAWEALPSSGISFNGSTANGVATYASSTVADVESTLTYVAGTGAQATGLIATDSDGNYVVLNGLPATGEKGVSITWDNSNVYGAINGIHTGTAWKPLSIGANADVYLSAGAGEVGIGTTTPTAKLNVYKSGGGTADVVTNIAGSTSSGTFTDSFGSTSDRATVVIGTAYTGGEGILNLESAGNSRLFVTAAGYVGMGTTAPTNALNVVGTAASPTSANGAAGVAYFTGAASDSGIALGSYTCLLYTSPSPRDS